jgi:hypothetical protein
MNFFEEYPGIQKMLSFIKEIKVTSISFEHEVKTEISAQEAGFCEFFHFKISPIRESNSMAKVLVIIIYDGLEHLEYHSEDFSDTELQAINDACEIEAARRQKASFHS